MSDPHYVVVDTDAFSHLWQGRSKASTFGPLLTGSVPVLSFTTIAEVHYGAAYARWGVRRRAQLDAALRPYVVVPYEVELAQLWGRLKAQARRSGHALAHDANSNDLWICATAMLIGAPVMTNNRAHYEDLPGLSLLP